MKARFLHCADIHLGNRQYNHDTRYWDFSRAYRAVVDTALAERVDFVVLAGDLFHHRSVDPRTLSHAVGGLQRLRAAGIPVLAVEGNHERAYHGDRMGWMHFLADQDLLILLDLEIEGGDDEPAPLRSWDAQRRRGAYFEPLPGLRVYGLRYYGAGASLAVARGAAALAAQDRSAIEYTIFMAHAGVEGVLDDKAGGLSPRQWAPLEPYVDYLALGHFHKPFALDGWIYNPGSTEACASNEAQWEPRGYLLVTVDTDTASSHVVQQGSNPKRPFHHLSFKTDSATDPDDLMARLGDYLQRKAADLRAELGDYAADERRRPVVELYLTGALPFDRSALDVRAIEVMLVETTQPLVGMVKDFTQSLAYAVEADESLTRAQLERQVLSGLLSRDVRYAEQSDAWAGLAIELKQLALRGAPPAEIAEQLATVMAQFDAQHL
jgi:exonuclease SbcD